MTSVIPLNPVQKEFLSRIIISNGNFDVIDTGSILAFDRKKSIDLIKRFSEDFVVTIKIFTIKEEDSNSEIRVRTDADHNIIEYTCVNFDNVLGTGTVSPIEIGSIGGKKLYIHFWLYSLGGEENTTLKLEYTIWKEK